MADDAKLKVIIEGDSKALIAAVGAASAATASGGKDIKGSLASIGKAFTVMGIAAVAAGTAITIGFVKKSVNAFIEFEQSLTRINAVMTELDATQRQTLQQSIRDIAAESQFTARQVTDAATQLVFAGMAYDDLIGDEDKGITGAVSALVDFAIAAGTPVETAAEISMAALSGFGLEVKEMTRVMDVMMTTYTSAFVTLEELGQTMKFLAPTARAAGISIEEAAAAAGALGNAGLKGTIAGTGLRMSINKLLSPTDDARKVMDELGLSFFTLTPRGETAQVALQGLSGSLRQSTRELEATKFAVEALNNELSDLSIEQQRNSLAIAEIRQRAARQGRTLTDQEIKTVERLQMANEDLSIQQQRLGIEQAVATKAQEKNSKTVADQKRLYGSLNREVQMQTTGLTSLVDVINQLEAAGATTSQVLEIFSVRGGTAIMALLGQADAFRDLTEANYESQGALAAFIEEIKTSVAFAMMQVKSNFEETQLVIGEIFADLLTMDGGVAEAMNGIAESIRANKEDWKDLAKSIGDTIVPLLFAIPALIDGITRAFANMRPFLNVIVGLFKLLGIILWPVFKLLEGIAWVVEKLTGSGKAGSVAASAGAGVATGAAIGSIIPGVGTAVGAVVGGVAGTIGALHEGGVTTGPSVNLIGEAGPEAIIPLDKLPRIIADAGYVPQNMAASPRGGPAQSAGGLTINFGSISISGGTNMTSASIREIMRTEMPKIVKDSYASGARGVV